MMKLLSVAIVAGLFFGSNQLDTNNVNGLGVNAVGSADANGRPSHRCWTDWFDRDNPSGKGDYETLRKLRRENPGKICRKPREMEAVTVDDELAPWQVGDVIYKSDTRKGFICRNKDQRRKRCDDYKVRFRCRRRFCEDDD